MNVQVRSQTESYVINAAKYWNLSIPISFSEKNVSCFGVGSPKKHPYRAGSFIGSVQQKGSCNCDVIELIPHCHGTHTESVGHILEDSVSVPEIFLGGMFAAEVITVEGDENLMITSAELVSKETLMDTVAIIIRTTPNDISKKTKNYGSQAHHLSKDAIECLNQKNIQHLLVDFPSIDPIEDGGKLIAHRTFWNVENGQTKINDKTLKQKTVTELIFVPNEVPDGKYILSLQTSNLYLDAVVSTPLIYPIENI